MSPGASDAKDKLFGLYALLCRLVSVTDYIIIKKHPLNSKTVGKKYDPGKTILHSGAQYYV
jgi:hypothetical protein